MLMNWAMLIKRSKGSRLDKSGAVAFSVRDGRGNLSEQAGSVLFPFSRLSRPRPASRHVRRSAKVFAKQWLTDAFRQSVTR